MSTLRTLSAIVISIAMLAAVAPGAGAQSTHASLDWNASYRWVHVDNIGPDPMAIFERARTGWLQTLRQGDSLLADGRPLFWSHRAFAGGLALVVASGMAFWWLLHVDSGRADLYMYRLRVVFACVYCLLGTILVADRLGRSAT